MRRYMPHAVTALVALVLGWGAAQLNAHPALQNFVDREAVLIRNLGFSCGVERWNVKTLDDYGAGAINYSTVARTNIPHLVSLPNDHPTGREAPTETTVWQLTGTHIVAFKQEPDSDIHLKLQSPLDGHPTMIAELPDMSCVTPNPNAAASAAQQRIGEARAAFLRYVVGKGYTLSGNYQTVDFPVTLQGVGFFDFDHGQNGVAVNAVEIHPVLSFRGW